MESKGGAEAALLYVAERAGLGRSDAERRLLAQAIDLETAGQTIDDMLANSRLTVNFHPDRRGSTGRTVAAGLLEDGVYRTQFETGLSNGARIAAAGGARTKWEQDLFGGAYGGSTAGRPVYGALDLFGDPYGGAPRFGSSFLALTAECLARATFCMGDSHLGPQDVGTSTQLWSVLAGAVEDSVAGSGFGRELSPVDFCEAVGLTTASAPSARELDRYVEAQIHGGIDLGRDVAVIYLDPSFIDTQIERDLQSAAQQFGFDLALSEGSEADPDAIAPSFRGPEIAELARNTTRDDGMVDAASIGRALAELPFTPPSPQGDAEDSPLQRYKKLWHCCLTFGTPPFASLTNRVTSA